MTQMKKAKYLTKSRFKLALECPTKLYYSNRDHGYFDRNEHNDFLQSLADGGNQVGELAKFKYHDNPVGAEITVEAKDYERALTETNAKLSKPGRIVIAEAALKHETFFVRVDIFIRDEATKTIEIIEVKSSSVTDKEVNGRFKGAKGGYITGWLPYLYDVTFQTEVAKLCFPGYTIRPKLLLLDANEVCDVEALHQNFRIVPVKDPISGKTGVQTKTPNTLTKAQLGSLAILREVAVDDIVDDLRIRPMGNFPHVPKDKGANLTSLMQWAGYLQENDVPFFAGVSKTCKSCQFRAPVGDPKKSGVNECFGKAISEGMLNGGKDANDRTIPLSIDIWGGGGGAASFAQKVIDHRRAFLGDVVAEDIAPANVQESVFMTAFERRMAQVDSVTPGGASILLNEDKLSEMDHWIWPLHMIDFETSAPAIPFFKGMHAYETLAFQFSYHIMEKTTDGKLKIRHANQWVSTKAEFFPSIEFVRALKNALMPNGELEGTVFRYHNHENIVLRKLRQMIDSRRDEVQNFQDLLDFIDLITKSSDGEGAKHEGAKMMVDLHRLIQEGFYSGKAGGSISLKYMLPAVLNDAPQLAELYRRPGIYGEGQRIPSLNFKGPAGHIWLQSDKGDDPYKTLPPVFGPDYEAYDELLFRLVGEEGSESEDSSINQGGLAMTAYNFTQYACLGEEERSRIEDALLRYCELDTLAMVMLVQGLMELRNKPLELSRA
jgi:hypothetical protein